MAKRMPERKTGLAALLDMLNGGSPYSFGGRPVTIGDRAAPAGGVAVRPLAVPSAVIPRAVAQPVQAQVVNPITGEVVPAHDPMEDQLATQTHLGREYVFPVGTSTKSVTDTASPEATLQPSSKVMAAQSPLMTLAQTVSPERARVTARAAQQPLTPDTVEGTVGFLGRNPLYVLKENEALKKGTSEYINDISPTGIPEEPAAADEAAPDDGGDKALQDWLKRANEGGRDLATSFLEWMTGTEEPATAVAEEPATPDQTAQPATTGDVTVTPNGGIIIKDKTAAADTGINELFKQQEALIEKLFPPLDTSNPKQDVADAYAERQMAKDALLAQLVLGGSMMAGAGPAWEGAGKGFIAAAGVFDKGYQRYANALQDSANRYAQTQKEAQTYETAKKSAVLTLLGQAAEQQRADLKDYREAVKERRAQTMDAFKPYLEQMAKAEFGTELNYDAETLSTAINHMIETGEFFPPGPPIKHTREVKT